MLDLPPHVRGLVFDLDGTLADTMPLHYRAWTAALQPFGVDFSEAVFYEFAGMPTRQIIATLNERHGHGMPVEETAAQKEDYFAEFIPQVKPVEPVLKVIEKYRGKARMAIATGGYRVVVGPTIAALGLTELFEGAVATADDVAHGKPAPDVFLHAAKLIDVPPEECVAFEDADLGVQAARSAGMLVIDVRRWPNEPAAF